MKNQGEFGAKPSAPDGKAGNPSDPLDCAAADLLWAEAAEGTLASPIAVQLHAHTAECASCREKLAQARSGHEWLLLLKQEPLEPPSDIVAKILAKTSHADASDTTSMAATVFGRKAPNFSGHHAVGDYTIRRNGDRQETESAGAVYLPGDGVPPVSSSLPAWQRNSVVVLRRTLFDPRLALVAAMAFFSISLTLNLTGVKLTNFRAVDLEPHMMRRAVSRQYVEANARVVRYYENLRIVYEVESQVHQLRQAAETNSQSGQTSNKSGKQTPGSSHDSSNDETDSHRVGMAANPKTRENRHAISPDPKPIMISPLFNAAFHPQVQFQRAPQRFSCAPNTVYFSTRERRLA